MNRSMCSGRVAAGPRALPSRARRAAAQRTAVLVYMSLRSVGVIAELVGVLPREGAPLLQKLVKAVKEDVEEAQQQRQQAVQKKDEAVAVMIREKDKLHRMELLLSHAMYFAGVRDGRSCLEYLENLNGIVKRNRVKGWTKLLKQRPDLIDCLATGVPSWGVDVDDPKAAEKLAGKIAGMFTVLNDHIHTFVPGSGLVVYHGVPDSPTSEALVCLAEALGVPCERQSVSL